MAWYKYAKFLNHFTNTGDAYDKLREPGEATPYAGIYRCAGCGREIGIAQGHTLPPQNHHQHMAGQGRIQWQLIVYADHEAK